MPETRDFSALWSNMLSILTSSLNEVITDAFFPDVSIVDLTADQIVLLCTSEFNLITIKKHYLPEISAACEKLLGAPRQVVMVGEEELKKLQNLQSGNNVLDNNREFRFDNFVVGSSNKFAHAAARAVAEKPAGSYNPLFIYGQSGLGKTHLLYAISNFIHDSKPDTKITYIKGEEFTNELITAIRENKNTEFRQKYRSSDVFLVDDIQFIAGKDSTQEEFFHTFNTLYEAKKQIVLTSDRPPKEMTRLEDRLKTRFEWGLLADIQPPDYETRMAIIRSKASSLGLTLQDDIMGYIAENITSNVRQLEGTVNKIMAYRDLIGDEIDLPTTARVIKDMYKTKGERLPTPELIIDETARYYGVTPADIRGQRRSKEIALARQVAIYITRKTTDLSLPDIGKAFGGRDHTTILHSCSKIEAQEKEGKEIAETIAEIVSTVNSKA